MTTEGTKTGASTATASTSTARTATMPTLTEGVSNMAETTESVMRIGDVPKKIAINLSEPGVYPAGGMPRKT